MAKKKTMSEAARKARNAISARVARAGIDQILVSQAQRRIQNSGDSEHRYPQLWVTRVGIESYRSGGRPLWDTGALYNSLSSRTETTVNPVAGAGFFHRFILRGSIVAAYHNSGFKTKGPNFIPLTRKAIRVYAQVPKRPGRRIKSIRSVPSKKVGPRSAEIQVRRVGPSREELRARNTEITRIFNEAGLRMGRDYIMAWHGVTVPQRKVYNMPREDRAEIQEALTIAIRG